MKSYARKSKGQTIDLIVDHVLIGITPEMLDWWWDNINDTERYKLWHPKSHKYFEWESNPNKHAGKIQIVLENIGRITTKLRIRWEDPDQIPIKTDYQHVLAGSILDDKNVPFSWLSHEYESINEGTKMRSTFRLPEKTPKWFINNLRKHNIEEMAEFPKFLPNLYQNKK
ncbi:MAG: phloretin hydrolase [Candidatus Lokiarchaeota archaeon]|nr:phloretin hydrolase [Candidatus Lokiarchaeota archaeon]